MYGIDKWKARKSKWRISEATLLLMAAIGGSIGAITQLALLFLCSCNTNHRFFKPKEQSDACIGYALAGKRAC